MNRIEAFEFRLAVVALIAGALCARSRILQAQAPAATPAPAPAATATSAPAAEEKDPPLPPGMTGSTLNDPRVGLQPGLYDAGEAAMGMEHVAFLKKPAAFQLSSTDPDAPEVQKALTLLGVGDRSKMSKPMQLVIAS